MRRRIAGLGALALAVLLGGAAAPRPAGAQPQPPGSLSAWSGYHHSIRLTWFPPLGLAGGPAGAEAPGAGAGASITRGERPALSPAAGAWEGEAAAPGSAGGTTTYRLWRAESPGGAFALLVDGLTHCWYRDDSAANGHAYEYQVTAVTGGEETPPSDPAVGTARANGYRIESRWAPAPPSIDGRIRASEWGNAAIVDITSPIAPPGTAPVTAFVMNDATHLFVAVREPNIPFPDDFNQIGIYYDQNHDGAWNSPPAQPEGNIWILYDATFHETSNWFRAITGEWPNGVSFVQFGDVPGVAQSLGFQSGDPEFEVAVDLANVPLVSAPGKTIGFGLYSDQTGDAPFTGEYPGIVFASPIYFKAPILYGDLVLATAPGAPVAIRTDDGDNVVIASPNPAQGGAAIRWSAPALRGKGGAARDLAIYDTSGRVVARIPWNGGAVWDGSDAGGARLPAGVYFGRLGGEGGPAGRVLLLR